MWEEQRWVDLFPHCLALTLIFQSIESHRIPHSKGQPENQRGTWEWKGKTVTALQASGSRYFPTNVESGLWETCAMQSVITMGWCSGFNLSASYRGTHNMFKHQEIVWLSTCTQHNETGSTKKANKKKYGNSSSLCLATPSSRCDCGHTETKCWTTHLDTLHNENTEKHSALWLCCCSNNYTNDLHNVKRW